MTHASNDRDEAIGSMEGEYPLPDMALGLVLTHGANDERTTEPMRPLVPRGPGGAMVTTLAVVHEDGSDIPIVHVDTDYDTLDPETGLTMLASFLHDIAHALMADQTVEAWKTQRAAIVEAEAQPTGPAGETVEEDAS